MAMTAAERSARYRGKHLDARRLSDRDAKRRARVNDNKRRRDNESTRSWRSRNPDRARVKHREYGARWRAVKINRDKANARTRAWYVANRDRALAAKVLRKYGLTSDALAKMIASQNGRCAICRDLLRGGRHRHIDHDHAKPGTARGVLCSECNSGIGKLRDDPSVILRAAEYVKNGGA